MKITELILKMANENNGLITSAMITEAGISREFLRVLLSQGMIEKTARGVYMVPNVFDDEMVNLQMRFKRGIFSHDTALFLMGLSDNTPIKFSMTFPLNYNTSSLKFENVSYYRVKEESYKLGIIDAVSPGGNNIRCYNAERTLCDILKLRSHTDIQIIINAFNGYFRQNNRNIPLLSEYGKIFHVEKRLRSYIEVLL